jgi:hypothetical protein
MRRRDPRLWQSLDHHELADVSGVSAVALGALLAAPPRCGLGRLGEMDGRADLRQLIGDEPPAGRCLQPDLELLAAELLTELAHALSVRRRDPRPTDLSGLGIDLLRGDVRAVLVKAHHDRHGTASSLAARAAQRPADDSRPIARPGRPRCTCHLSNHAGWSSVGDGRHSKASVRPSRADSVKVSQPATGREPNRPAGQHRSRHSLSLSMKAHGCCTPGLRLWSSRVSKTRASSRPVRLLLARRSEVSSRRPA